MQVLTIFYQAQKKLMKTQALIVLLAPSVLNCYIEVGLNSSRLLKV